MAKKTTRKKTRKKTSSKKKSRPTRRKKTAARSGSRKKSPSRKSKTKKKTKGTAKKKTRKKKTNQKAQSKKKSSASKKKTTKKKKKKRTTGKKKASSAKKSSGTKGGSKTTKKKQSSSKAQAKKSGGSKSATPKSQRGRSVLEVAATSTADADGYVVINGRRVRMISTRNNTEGKKKKKRRRSAVAASAPESQTAKPVKTKLTRRELNKYKKLLLIKRAEIVGDLSAMEAEALRASDGDLSNMPIHMADLGSDTYEQDFMLGMAESERQRIREIDAALQRIEDRTYGICQMTGKPIPKARLEAKPWAKYTIEAARQLEGSGTTWGT